MQPNASLLFAEVKRMKDNRAFGFNAYVVLRDLALNFWVIVLAFLIGFVGVRTYLGSIYVPKYRSSMTVAVNVSGSNVTQNISKTIEIAGIFKNVFQSDVMKKILGENVTDFEVAKVSASVVEQTNLLVLTAEGKDAVDAYKTLRAVYENYQNVLSKNLFEDVYIDEIIAPTVPFAPFNTVSSKKYSVLAGLALALFCAFLIALLSSLRDTVKSESDIEKKLDASFFGKVYHQHPSRAMIKKAKSEKGKVVLDIRNPMLGYAFCESINRVSTKIEYLKNSRSAKTFIVTSVDEHEGKTTVSVNTALNLSFRGYKTLLIDADLRRPSAFRFFGEGFFGSYSELGDFLLGKVELCDILKHDEKSGLDVIGGKNSYRFAFELLSSELFKDTLASLYEKYDYIIIDTPPTSLTADTEGIADLADVTLLVVRLDRTPVPVINDAADILSGSKSFFAGCILNDYRDVYSALFKGRMSGFSDYGAEYYYGYRTL